MKLLDDPKGHNTQGRSSPTGSSPLQVSIPIQQIVGPIGHTSGDEGHGELPPVHVELHGTGNEAWDDEDEVRPAVASELYDIHLHVWVISRYGSNVMGMNAYRGFLSMIPSQV